MKTRVIQSDPDEASETDKGTDGVDTTNVDAGQVRNVAARMARWSAQHRKKAIWGWLAFVAIAFVIGGAIGDKKPANQNDYIGQSGKADRLLDNHFPKQEDETVLVQAPKGGKATDPAARKAVDDVIAGVSHQQGVAEVKSPYAKGNQGQVSKDGRSVNPTIRKLLGCTRNKILVRSPAASE